MLNKVKIFVLCMSCILGFGFNLVEVEAVEKDKEIDLLLTENANIQEVTEAIEKIDSNIKITKYEEVSLLHLDLPATVSTKELVENRVIENSVEEIGNMPDMEMGRIDLGAIYSGSPVIGGYQEYGLQRSTDEELFDLLGWHVDEVTEKRRSLEISTGEGVRIALIDSGVDYNHPVLAENIDMINAQSFVDNSNDVADTNGHGTMVAGIIKQVAPNAVITPYRVIGDSTGDSSWTISAFIEAINDGNDIINASLGTYKCKDIEDEKLTIKAFKRAIKYAEKNDVIVVASAGNLGLNLDEYYKDEHMQHLPGSIKSVNTVSAVLEQKLTSYSNYGSDIKYCAPGGDLVYIDGYLNLDSMIYCLYPINKDNGLSTLGIPQGYTFSYGTSFSAPIVSAGSADILSYYRSNYKKVKSKDIEKALSKGTIDLGETGKDIYYGEGEINIYNSLMNISK